MITLLTFCIVSLSDYSLPPLPPLPPGGTEKCEEVLECDNSGLHCHWVAVCR